MRSLVERAFAPSRGTRRMGLEIEMHVRRGQPSLSQELVDRCLPTFEPGGQLELSIRPLPSVDAVVREAEWAVGSVVTCAEVALTGVNPWYSLSEVPLVRPTPRYRSMQALFDERGDAGRRMMRLTASLQVCVDLLPGVAGGEQWLVANLAGPFLVAAFGPSRERTDIWRAMDPVRTAYDGRHLDPHDPVAAYTAFVEAAPRLPIPEAADDSYHLCTVFPPVRPRGGYLELRYLDSQPATTELLGTIWTLMYDEVARSEALELLVPTLPDFHDSWGSADPTDLLAIASAEGMAA